MAAAVGAAGGGGGAAGGGGDDQEDVPDVRFLMESRAGSGQSLVFEITFVERQQIFINFLRSKGFGEDELETAHQVSDQMNMQRRAVVQVNGSASGLFVRMLRKRRHILFLKMMLNAYGSSKTFKPDIPFRYRNAGQLQGDIRALEEQLESLTAEAVRLKDRVKALRGRPVKMPDVLKKALELPK